MQTLTEKGSRRCLQSSCPFVKPMTSSEKKLKTNMNKLSFFDFFLFNKIYFYYKFLMISCQSCRDFNLYFVLFFWDQINSLLLL